MMPSLSDLSASQSPSPRRKWTSTIPKPKRCQARSAPDCGMPPLPIFPPVTPLSARRSLTVKLFYHCDIIMEFAVKIGFFLLISAIIVSVLLLVLKKKDAGPQDSDLASSLSQAHLEAFCEQMNSDMDSMFRQNKKNLCVMKSYDVAFWRMADEEKTNINNPETQALLIASCEAAMPECMDAPDQAIKEIKQVFMSSSADCGIVPTSVISTCDATIGEVKACNNENQAMMNFLLSSTGFSSLTSSCSDFITPSEAPSDPGPLPGMPNCIALAEKCPLMDEEHEVHFSTEEEGTQPSI